MNKFSKFLKHGKRLVAIMLVLFMNINSFATTTSNDGSAFITKAEFDSLINNFNEQMDIYQSGFNAKIDTSIAQYLAGLATQTSTTLPVLNPLWSEVSAFNGKIAPTFTIPDLNIYYGGGAKGYVSWSGGYKRYSLSISARYTYSNGNKNTRALVKCNVNEDQQSASGAKFAWDGVENSYKESWSINAGLDNQGAGDLYGVEGPESKSFRIENGININLSNGYISNLSTLTSIVDPKIYYVFNGGTNTSLLSFPNKNVRTVAQVATSDREYEHIIAYDGTDSWCVSEPSFTKTVRSHSSSSVTSNIMSSVSKDATGSVTCMRQDNDGSWQGSSLSTSYAHSTVNSVKYPSIGMLSSDKAANTILQTLDDISYEYANKKGKLQDVKLHVGLPVLAAAKDSTIKWSPRFTLGKTWSSTESKWVDSTATRVKLLLSVGEFSDKIASTNIIAAESPVGKTTDGGVLCNICKEAKDVATEISFKMPKDGVVYAKWVPDTGSYDSDDWIQPLDLSKSGTYILMTE